jgi:minor extracellular serine protease Vpr
MKNIRSRYRSVVSLLLLISIATYAQQPEQPRALVDPLIRYVPGIGTVKSVPDDSSPLRGVARLSDGATLLPVTFHGTEKGLASLPVSLITHHTGIATAFLPLDQLEVLAQTEGISYIEYNAVHDIQLDVSIPDIRADSVHLGYTTTMPYTGRGVLLGIIDTGIDFFHPDFRDPTDSTRTRVISLWDMTIEAIGDEIVPNPFGYGVEYTREDIERELRGDTTGYVRSVDANGHGTHVAGIAGGNGMKSEGKYRGVAPDADFIIVQFPASGVSTASVIHGIEYIFSLADELNRPAVINLSIGGHGGSHDGTAGHEVVIDAYAVTPGRVVVAAAGNSGATENHAGGTVTGAGDHGFTLTVPSYTPKPEPGDDYMLLSLWYEGSDSIALTVRPPNEDEYTVTTYDDSLRESTPAGAIEVNTHSYYTNPKGARLISVYIYDKEQDHPPATGTWSFTVSTLADSDTVRYNTWLVSRASHIERPVLGPNSGRRHTVTMPGTAEKAITAGAYSTKLQWLNANNETSTFNGILSDLAPFSGGGPTRDLRLKPDITAPGRFVAAPLSSDAGISGFYRQNDAGYAVLSGTSMATPHVTGMVALMLEANPLLNATDILEIIRRNGRPDTYAVDLPNTDWGYGKIDVQRAVEDAGLLVSVKRPATAYPTTFRLEQNYPNPFNPSTTIQFILPETQRVRLSVYDILGREVGVLTDGELESGIHSVRFDAGNLSSGLYFYRLEVANITQTRSMILLR